MTDTFVLRLLPYGKDFPLPRKEFRYLFPESIISTALDDETATVIEITQPVVTPKVGEYLTEVIAGQLRYSPDPEEDLTSAGRYLNIPFLEVVSDPKYPELLLKYPHLDIVDSRVLMGYYPWLVPWALWNKYRSLLSYLWSRVTDDPERSRLNHSYAMIAAYQDMVPEFKYLSEHMTEGPVDAEILGPIIDGTKPYVTMDNLTPLVAASLGNANAVLAYLVANPTLISSSESGLAIRIAADNRNLPGIDLIRPLISTYREGMDFATDLATYDDEFDLLSHLLGTSDPIEMITSALNIGVNDPETYKYIILSGHLSRWDIAMVEVTYPMKDLSPVVKSAFDQAVTIFDPPTDEESEPEEDYD